MKQFKRRTAIITIIAMMFSMFQFATAFGQENVEPEQKEEEAYVLEPLNDATLAEEEETKLEEGNSSSGLYDEDGQKVYYIQKNADSSYDNPKAGDLKAYNYESSKYAYYELSGNAIGGKTVYSDEYIDVSIYKYVESSGWECVEEPDYGDLGISYKWSYNGNVICNRKKLTISKVSKSGSGIYTMTGYVNDYNGNPQILFKDYYRCRPKSASIVFYTAPSTANYYIYTAPSSLQMKKGRTLRLRAWVRTGDKLKKFTSSNSKVVSVASNGKISAKKTGTATITAYSVLGAKDKIKITVKSGTVKTKSIKSSTKWIGKGEKMHLTYALSPITSTQGATFKSSNSKVVSIDKKGYMRGRKKGKATITIKSGSVSKKVTVKVYD